MKKSILRKLLIPVALILFATANFSCSNSRQSVGVEQGWDLLGERKVNFVRDRDAIEVRNSNRYTAIRFQIEKRDVRLNSLSVNYVNGDKLSPQVDDVIPAGQTSRIIELAADGKVISSIDFKYRTEGSILKGRGRVLVFGKRYDPGY
ncbi:MAG: hypothetical protein ABIP30_05255 [Ferruginibacter sp.]